MGMSRRERLDEVYRRLADRSAPGTAQDALDQLREVLEEVEDEHSGIAKQDPPPADGGGRMYFPLEDRIVGDSDGGITATTMGHTITVVSSGHMTIRNRSSNEVEFQR